VRTERHCTFPQRGFFLLSALTLVIGIASPGQTTRSTALTPVTEQRAHQVLDAMPLIFETNQGQHDPRASFVSRTPEYTLYLTGHDATIVHPSHKKNGAASALHMEWLNANPAASAAGDDRIAANSNYFIGPDASHWHSGVPNYQRVSLNSLYPGIDLVYYGKQDQLEYDLTVAPGADPNLIRLHIDGAKNIRLDKATGDLVVRDAIGSEMRIRKPLLYQGPTDPKARRNVAGHYILSARNTVSFAVGAYDPTQPLVIDPYVVYSTVFGGSAASGYASNLLTGMAVDGSGYVYLHGITNFTNLPTTSGAFQPTCNQYSSTQCSNFFVAKFDTTQSGAASLVYATYIGGSESKIGSGEQNAIYTQANSLAVDSSGDAYITGYSSTDNYPTTSNAYSTACGWAGSTSCYGGVLSKLNPTGTALLYSTYFPTASVGGSYGVTQPVMIAIDSSQIAYIAGLSSPGLITTDGSADNGGGTAPFIAAFDTTKSGSASLVYSEYLSLNQNYPIVALAADPSGNAYIAGDLWPANNPAAGLTSASITLNGFQTTTGNSAGIGPVLLRLNHSGAITYASYVGSSNTDPGVYYLSALSVDATGNAYVGGKIATPAPLMNGLASTSGITAGAYLAKVNTNLTGTASLLYATFLTANANNASSLTGIANTSTGLAGFVGYTSSAPTSDIEVNPITQPANSEGGSGVQFAGIVDTTQTGDAALTFLSYIDGAQGELTAVSFDPTNANNLIIGGLADVGNTNDPFLSVPASFATTEGNTNDPPFFYKISLTSPSNLTVSPATLTFSNQVLTTTSTSQAVTVTNNGTTAITFSSIAASAQFGETDNCGTSLAASSSCTVNVTFTPAATGAQTGTLTLTDSDPSSPQTVGLSGTGINGTPQAALSPATVAFGNQTVNTTSSAQVVVLSNPGTAALSITGVSITGAHPTNFADTSACGSSLAAGSSCNISVNFTPASAASFSASLSVADNASGSPQAASLTGTGTLAQAALSPSALAFPNTTVGSTATAISTTLTNSGNATLNISSIALTGANQGDFTISANTCGATLAASAACTISVTFSPASVASFTAAISVTDDATGSPQSTTLSGTGVAALVPQAALSPTSLSFGNQNTGTTSAAQTVTLSNSGTAALTITSISIGGTNAGNFAISANNCGTALAASASCSISLTFAPTAATSYTATISATDNAAGSPQAATLSGSGVAPADFTVSSTTATQTVNPGSLASYSLVIASSGSTFSSPVTLSVAGLPRGATASFAPTAVTPGNSSASSIMTVQTPQLVGREAPMRLPWLPPAATVAFCLPYFWQRRRSMQRLLSSLLLCGLLSAVALMVGCGGGFGAPAVNYTLTVTGTSGTDVHSTTVNLTVQ
jgi:Abnormal spindle-like microcephaly-assoc'd, ASPM-SPD-2-Hydin/Beta-propeller repeat